MKIETNVTDGVATIKVKGRLDTNSSPELMKKTLSLGGDVKKVVFDFSDLDYISSSGLRLLLSTNKRMEGNMVVSHPNDTVCDIFDITGFDDILQIEQ